MMAPFLTNPLSSNVHDPNASSLLPNLQPFMYTTNTMQRHEVLSSTSSNGTIPLSPPSQVPQPTQPATEEESEEKRNKRLERNRESARKCRLKKKERLHTLGMQVTELHKKIEHERCTIINNMVPVLMQHCRQHEIRNCIESAINNGTNLSLPGYYNALTEIIRGSGPSSSMMRSVLDFQYSTLKDITLPHHQKLLLWFTTQKESFFYIGKEQYYIEQQKKIKQQQQTGVPNLTKEAANQTTVAEPPIPVSGSTGIRPNAIKISSKQIGEELMTGSTSNNSSDDPLPKKRQSKSSTSGNGGITSSAVYDGAKTWPLFCFELKLSVDQEERFIGKHKQIIADDGRQVKTNMNATPSTYRSLSYIREEIAVAVTTTENLGKAVGTLSHIIAQRDENTYLNILHPQQVSRYYNWLSQHREAMRQTMARPAQMECVKSGQKSTTLPSTMDMDSVPSTLSSMSTPTAAASTTSDVVSLQTISRRLSEVLQISSRQDHGNAAFIGTFESE
jgi:bZIP transcription factor